MNIPTLRGIIRRRILLNYRMDPELLQPELPQPFRPKLQQGHAVVGICLIRLEQLRPKGMPGVLGISSENAAHRFAVQWEEQGEQKEGVYIPRRDTDSRMNAWAGGRVFPGVHHHARFEVADDGNEIRMQVHPDDASEALVDLALKSGTSFPASSIFASLEEASRFFEEGAVGYSGRPDSTLMDGLLLKVPQWQVSSLEVLQAHSSYFADRSRFPEGSVELDHALLMRHIDHEWHSLPTIRPAEARH